MRRTLLGLLLAATTAGACGNSGAPPSAALRADLEKICNVVELSGASGLEEADRQYLTAQYLGTNIRTAEGTKFLQDLAKLGGDKAARGKLLEGTAASVGLKSCPLVDEYK